MKNNMKGILLMAYGSPNSVQEVGEYFTHIRRGVRPSDDFIARIEDRYRAVGGRTPLLEITRSQASALQMLLDQKEGVGTYKVYVGMKHWHPLIKNVFEEIRNDGIEEVLALALAPHYSKMSIGGYGRFIEEARGDCSVELIESWHTEPSLITCIVDQIKKTLGNAPNQHPHFIYTAHSLPEKIREWHDPYERQIEETATLIAEQFPTTSWSVAYQSMGSTSEPWIGPHLLDEIERLSTTGTKDVLVIPIGFVSDNLEISFDIDIEARGKAQSLGMTLRRPEMRNTHPLFIEALHHIIATH